MIFNIILTVAVVGSIGPAAGAAAGLCVSTNVMGTGKATFASETAKVISKDALKNSSKASAAKLISESNKMVRAILTMQGDPVEWLTNAVTSAADFRVLATEKVQRLIVLSAALAEVQIVGERRPPRHVATRRELDTVFP